MDYILLLDKELFYFINVKLANPIIGGFFAFLTDPKSWIIVYLGSIWWLLTQNGKQGRIVLLTILIAILINDQFCSHFLKDLVGRLRPCKTLEDIVLLVKCGPGKSFPSSHASNNFTVAMVLSHYYKSKKWLFITIAALIAISRVVVGVHYPIDIIAGSAIGIAIGWGITKIVKTSVSYFENKKLAKYSK